MKNVNLGYLGNGECRIIEGTFLSTVINLSPDVSHSRDHHQPSIEDIYIGIF